MRLSTLTSIKSPIVDSRLCTPNVTFYIALSRNHLVLLSIGVVDDSKGAKDLGGSRDEGYLEVGLPCNWKSNESLSTAVDLLDLLLFFF